MCIQSIEGCRLPTQYLQQIEVFLNRNSQWLPFQTRVLWGEMAPGGTLGKIFRAKVSHDARWSFDVMRSWYCIPVSVMRMWWDIDENMSPTTVFVFYQKIINITFTDKHFYFFYWLHKECYLYHTKEYCNETDQKKCREYVDSWLGARW